MVKHLANFFGSPRIYLDYAAATPVRAEVVRAMHPYESEAFANPSAIHKEGVRARRAVEESREKIARTLRCRPADIIFTSGGTESNNIGIVGVIEALHKDGRAYADMEILTLPTEHPSVLNTCEHLALHGVSVRMIPILEDGLIDWSLFPQMISDRTALIVCAYANSETGVVQDIKKITRAARSARTGEHGVPYVFVDASQAPLYLSCAVDSLGVDLMTLDSGKCYGPKGVGVLMARPNVELVSSQFGGDQEKGLRPGTENVSRIVGCTEAIIIAQRDMSPRTARVSALRDYFFNELLAAIPDAVVNGSRDNRIAHNVNISIAGVDGEFAVVTLDTNGIAASTKSACAGAHGGGSHVVRAMTQDEERAKNTIRFTLGEGTTRKEIDRVVSVLKEHGATVRSRPELYRKI